MSEQIKLHGNYDDECARQLVELGADVVCLIVIGGSKGSGFSVSGIDRHPADNFIPQLPAILRYMADSIEEQMKQQKKQ